MSSREGGDAVRPLFAMPLFTVAATDTVPPSFTFVNRKGLS